MTTICLLNNRTCPLRYHCCAMVSRNFGATAGLLPSIPATGCATRYARIGPAQEVSMERLTPILLILLMPMAAPATPRERSRKDRGRTPELQTKVYFGNPRRAPPGLSSGSVSRSIILITLHLFFKGPSNSFPLSSTLGKRSFACCLLRAVPACWQRPLPFSGLRLQM
jgi:hypothetical protein